MRLNIYLLTARYCIQLTPCGSILEFILGKDVWHILVVHLFCILFKLPQDGSASEMYGMSIIPSETYFRF